MYWIKAGPDERVQVTRGDETWDEVRGHSDLMITSLADGATRKLCFGLSASTLLFAGAESVFWTEPHPFPDTRVDLCSMQPGDDKPHVLPNFEADLYFVAPVEYQGRLYWFASETVDSLRQRRVPRLDDATQLVSTDRDGSDRRVLFSLPALRKRLTAPLSLHRGALYFRLADPYPSELPTAAQAAKQPQYLCRLHPERADPVEVVCKLPGQTNSMWFDGGYFYFLNLEEHRSLWAWLTDDDAHTQIKQTLYRVHLPE